MTKIMIQRTFVVSALALLILTGCSDDNSAVAVAQPVDSQTDGNNQGNTDPLVTERRLQQIDNSDEFFTALRDGLVQQQVANTNQTYYIGGAEEIAVSQESTVEFDVDTVQASPSVDFAGSEESADSSASSSTTSDSVLDVTTTNVQEVGVDEQDKVKSDGEFLYVLDNTYSYGGPEIFIDEGLPLEEESDVSTVSLSVDALPVDADIDIAVDSDIAASSFGYPQEVNTKVRILSLQPDAPDATIITELDIDIGGASADGIYLYKTDAQRSLILTASSFPNYYAFWNDSYAFSQTQSLVTKLDVTEPSQSSVENTIQIDGQIISSRRIGSNLFLASRFYPAVQGIDPYSMSTEEYQNALDAIDFNEVLPKMTRTSDGMVTDLIDPAGCFVAASSDTTDYYYTPDIVTLAVIDLDTMELNDSECFLGSSETLYATPNSVFLATTRWDYSAFASLDIEDSFSSTQYVDPRVDTDIHQFTIDGSELTYSGSGVVEGHLGWNPLRKPFRMSEKDGYLRVATFSDQQSTAVSPINVSVLKLASDGELTKVAQIPNDNNPEHIGKPGEQLYASRYLGDRGYLVTFRQTDPLYVIDFSNPEDPKLAGELEIEGYSDYLQPIGEDHLLGIGRDATSGLGDFGTLEQGIKLSLFNVADASNPYEVQSVVVGERGTYSAALQNHRAITVQQATDTHPTRIAFGIDVAGSASPEPDSNPTVWNSWSYTGLHGFEVHVDDNASIEQRGVMVVNSASNPTASDFGYYSDDRSVIVGDSVYYIHGSAVYAANWSDLSNVSGPR